MNGASIMATGINTTGTTVSIGTTLLIIGAMELIATIHTTIVVGFSEGENLAKLKGRTINIFHTLNHTGRHSFLNGRGKGMGKDWTRDNIGIRQIRFVRSVRTIVRGPFTCTK